MKKIKVILLVTLILVASIKVVYLNSESNRVLGISDEIVLVNTSMLKVEKEAIIPTLVIVGALALAATYTAASSWAQNPEPNVYYKDKHNQQLYFID